MLTLDIKNKNFLYIAPLKDEKYFKIGISSKPVYRLSTHNRNFSVDFDKTLIFIAEKEAILKVIEK